MAASNSSELIAPSRLAVVIPYPRLEPILHRFVEDMRNVERAFAQDLINRPI
jgi:hypothetical protein